MSRVAYSPLLLTPCGAPFGPSPLSWVLCPLLTSAARSETISHLPQSRFRDIRQISRGKYDRLQRTTAGFTSYAVDGYGLRDHTLARPALAPHIRFLFIGSRFCSALPSDPFRAPLRSATLHLHQVGGRLSLPSCRTCSAHVKDAGETPALPGQFTSGVRHWARLQQRWRTELAINGSRNNHPVGLDVDEHVPSLRSGCSITIFLEGLAGSAGSRPPAIPSSTCRISWFRYRRPVRLIGWRDPLNLLLTPPEMPPCICNHRKIFNAYLGSSGDFASGSFSSTSFPPVKDVASRRVARDRIMGRRGFSAETLATRPETLALSAIEFRLHIDAWMACGLDLFQRHALFSRQAAAQSSFQEQS